MTFDEFVQEERTIEANHPDFFTTGKKLADYVLIVFNMRTGYKRHEWINKDELPEEVQEEVLNLIERLQTSQVQTD